MDFNEFESELNESNVGDMIGAFKKIVDNSLAKYLLQRTLNYCQKDESIKLENALNLYLRKKEHACYKCRFMSKIVGYLVKKGATGFGTSEDKLKEAMDNDYLIKGLSSVFKGIALFGVQKPFVPGAPFQIVWNITKACNMRCMHCYEVQVKRKKRIFISRYYKWNNS